MNHKLKSEKPDPRHTFVGVPDLMARYGLGRTATYGLVKEPGFPVPIAPRRCDVLHPLLLDLCRKAFGLENSPTCPRKREVPAAFCEVNIECSRWHEPADGRGIGTSRPG